MADIILLFTVIGVCAVRAKATMEVECNQDRETNHNSPIYNECQTQ